MHHIMIQYYYASLNKILKVFIGPLCIHITSLLLPIFYCSNLNRRRCENQTLIYTFRSLVFQPNHYQISKLTFHPFYLIKNFIDLQELSQFPIHFFNQHESIPKSIWQPFSQTSIKNNYIQNLSMLISIIKLFNTPIALKSPHFILVIPWDNLQSQ